MPQVLCMDPVKVDVQAKRKQQEELRSYLDDQVHAKSTLNASKQASLQPFLDYQTASLQAKEAAEKARLEYVAETKKAYKADLDRQAADDRRRREAAQARSKMGTTAPMSVNAFTGRPAAFELVPTPLMGTLGVKIGYAVVPTRKHKHTREY